MRNSTSLEMLRDGYLDSPRVDPELIDAMQNELDRGLEVWGDDRFEVVVELLP